MKLTARGLTFGLFFLLCAPGAVGGGLAIAPLQAIAGLIVAPWRGLVAGLRRHRAILAPLALFALWAAASALWSQSPTAHIQALKVLLVVASGLLFVAGAARATVKPQMRAAALVGVASLIALLAIEAIWDLKINRIFQPHAETGELLRNPAKGAAVLIVWLAPALAALPRAGRWRWAAAAAMIVAALALSTQFAMDADFLACVAALIAFGAAYLAPRIVATGSIWAIGLWLAGAPWLCRAVAHIPTLEHNAPLSWQQRTYVWDFAVDRIFERPWFGWGLDASHMFNQRTNYGTFLNVSQIPLHPHSASLNIWLDTGAVGAALGALALFIGGWYAGRAATTRADAGAIAGAAAAIGIIWNVSFGAWQEWWIAAAFTAVAIAFAARRD